MNFRLPIAFAVIFACLPRHAEDLPGGLKTRKEKHPAGEQSGWLKKIAGTVWPFGRKPADAPAPPPEGSEKGKAWHDLVPTISIEPVPLKLSDVRTIKVTLRLSNHARKLAQLEFPTTQRIEVLVKDGTGKRIEQWSEDQSFQNEPTVVTINPNERLEYTANVATRELKAGQSYTIEGLFPNYDQLRAVKQVTPLP